MVNDIVDVKCCLVGSRVQFWTFGGIKSYRLINCSIVGHSVAQSIVCFDV